MRLAKALNIHGIRFAALLFAVTLLAACRTSGDAPAPAEVAAPVATTEGSAAAAAPAPVAEELPGPIPANMALAEQTAAIAREIRSAPENASAVLARVGLTPEQLEANLFQIAADPNAASLYTRLLEAP